MAGKIDLYDGKWIELVFRGRNQEYGAFEIRKSYPKHAFFGIVLAIVAFTLSVSAPLIIRLISNALPDEKIVKVDQKFLPLTIDNMLEFKQHYGLK